MTEREKYKERISNLPKPDYRAIAEELAKALDGLTKANVRWNKAVAMIATTPPTWSDNYLDDARAALAHAKEAGLLP